MSEDGDCLLCDAGEYCESKCQYCVTMSRLSQLCVPKNVIANSLHTEVLAIDCN